jgi:hypothetical protein
MDERMANPIARARPITTQVPAIERRIFCSSSQTLHAQAYYNILCVVRSVPESPVQWLDLHNPGESKSETSILQIHKPLNYEKAVLGLGKIDNADIAKAYEVDHARQIMTRREGRWSFSRLPEVKCMQI